MREVMWAKAKDLFLRSNTPTFTLPVNGSGCHLTGRGKSILSFFLMSLNYFQRHCIKTYFSTPAGFLSITAAINYHAFGDLQQYLITLTQFCGSEVWCQSCWFCWGLWGRIHFRLLWGVSRVSFQE